jgi:hypothetical protein
MWEAIKKFTAFIQSSLDNNTAGASGKKLTALAVTLAYCYSHRYVNNVNLPMVLAADAAFISTLFGINVVEKIKTNQNDNSGNPS